MRQLRALLPVSVPAVCAAALLAPTTPALAAPSPASTTTVSSAAASEAGSTLVDVRAAHHAGFDRVVFEFAGGLPSSYDVRPVDEIHSEATGEPVRLAGRRKLAVVLRDSVSHDLDGRSTAPTRRSFALPQALETVRTGDFEGVTSYGIGLTTDATVTTRTLSSPARLVVDIATSPTSVPVTVYFAEPARSTGTSVAVRPVTRSTVVPSTPAAALDRVFAGPTAAERARGLRTRLSGVTGFRSLSVREGVARVRLTGSCDPTRAAGLAQQTLATLKAVPGVTAVKIYDPSGHTPRPSGARDSVPSCLR